MMIRALPDGLILTPLPLQRPYFQIGSHLEVLRVRKSPGKRGGYSSAHVRRMEARQRVVFQATLAPRGHRRLWLPVAVGPESWKVSLAAGKGPSLRSSAPRDSMEAGWASTQLPVRESSEALASPSHGCLVGPRHQRLGPLFQTLSSSLPYTTPGLAKLDGNTSSMRGHKGSPREGVHTGPHQRLQGCNPISQMMEQDAGCSLKVTQLRNGRSASLISSNTSWGPPGGLSQRSV